MTIYNLASPERRKQLATQIALSCGWESLDAMRQSVAKWDVPRMVLVPVYVLDPANGRPLWLSPDSLASLRDESA